MFSKAARKCVLWSIQNVDCWKTVPVKLDPGTGTVVLVTSKKRRALAWLNILVLFAYTAFLGFRCISAHMDSASGTDQRVLFEYFFGGSLMPLLYQAVLVLQRRQVLAFVRTYPKSLEHIWGKRLKLD